MDFLRFLRFFLSEGEDELLIRYELLFLALILIITMVAMAVRGHRIRLPYTVALVIVGLVLSFVSKIAPVRITEAILFDPQNQIPKFHLTEGVILAIFVAPLVFEAALHIDWELFKKDLLPILLLAVPGVILASFVVGAIVSQRLDIPFAMAVAFGALISATDPVAVVAFFRSLGVSNRLAMLVEGESLLNDGVSIVLFSLAIGMSSGVATQFYLTGAVVRFVYVAGGGLLIGVILGRGVSVLLERIDDHLIETTFTLALAFGSFVIAESFQMSGILAVVAAGIVLGSMGLNKVSPSTRIVLENFWEFLSFVANSVLFLLLGLEIDFLQLWEQENLLLIGIAIVAILLSRIVVVYGMSWVSGLFGNHVPVKFRHILFWGGLRGAVSLALALSVTGPYQEKIRLMTFGVVLFTLLVQGLTVEGFVKTLGLSEITRQAAQQHRLARLLTARSAKGALSRLHGEGLVTDSVYRALFDVSNNEVQEMLENHPELEQSLIIETRREMIKAERVALSDTLRRNVISEDVYHLELAEIDKRLLIWDHIEDRFKLARPVTPSNATPK